MDQSNQTLNQTLHQTLHQTPKTWTLDGKEWKLVDHSTLNSGSPTQSQTNFNNWLKTANLADMEELVKGATQ